jgi:hypothetical protein
MRSLFFFIILSLITSRFAQGQTSKKPNAVDVNKEWSVMDTTQHILLVEANQHSKYRD